MKIRQTLRGACNRQSKYMFHPKESKTQVFVVLVASFVNLVIHTSVIWFLLVFSWRTFLAGIITTVLVLDLLLWRQESNTSALYYKGVLTWRL
jgi:hypothetical protein